jgi:leucine dehydrogenase
MGEFNRLLRRDGGDGPRLYDVTDFDSGLEAVIVLDDLTLGPAAGGICTLPYPNRDAAVADAHRLAAAMTLKCAIAGVNAGGGHTVVIDHPTFDRQRGFRKLGAFIEGLKGQYRCAGARGTTAADLANVADATQHVNKNVNCLGEATASTVMQGILACAHRRGKGLPELRVAVQGCGIVGSTVSHALRRAGADVLVADLVQARALALAAESGATAVPAESILVEPVDIVAPCATADVITPEVAARMSAWGICGGANRQLADALTDIVLARRGIDYVPDFLAASGAVIADLAAAGGQNARRCIKGVYDTAKAVLEEAASLGATSVDIARARARSRIGAARTGTFA